jgi:hypothetical protein
MHVFLSPIAIVSVRGQVYCDFVALCIKIQLGVRNGLTRAWKLRRFRPFYEL